MIGVPAYPGCKVPSINMGHPTAGSPVPGTMVCGPKPMLKSIVVLIEASLPQLKLPCWMAARSVQSPAFVLHW